MKPMKMLQQTLRNLTRTRAFVLTGTLAFVATLTAGCARLPVVSQAEREDLYARADRWFDQTVLVKPEDSERPEFRLAPLLIQQVRSGDRTPEVPYTVYFWPTFGRWHNQVLEQFNYLWFYESEAGGRKTPQGVRITLDTAGRPIVWEILRDRTGARILYVSQAVEGAAMREFPAPLAHRRFWVERGVSETPEVVVARVINDSETIMGPILYLEAGTHDVSTLICRCMEAQAREVLGTGTYGLAMLDDAAVRWLNRFREPAWLRWLPGKPGDDLGQWLRGPLP